MRILLLKTLRDLRAAWTQSLALMVIVALGIASLLTLVGAYRDLSTSYNHTYDRLRFADVTFSLSGAPEEVAQSLTDLEGVEAATGRLVVDSGFERRDGELIRSRLIGIDPTHHPSVNDVLILDGRFLSGDDSMAALLESHFAEIHGHEPGDVVLPLLGGRRVALEVVGVAASPEYLIVSPSRQEILPAARTFAVLFVGLHELQSLTGLEGTVNDIAIRVEPGSSRSTVIARIRDRLEPYGLIATTLREDQPSNAALQLDLEGYRELAFLMPTIILAVAAASVYVMLGRLVHAQRPQIGVLKAVGYGSRTVLVHYLAFALIIAVLGSALGLMLGLPLMRGTTQIYAAELGIPLVQTRFQADLALMAPVLFLVLSIVAGLGPALASSRASPAQAMRLDPAVALVGGGKSLPERVIQLPLWIRLPLRNVFRVRRRSLTTLVGVVFAFVLVLMSWGMFDSMDHFLELSFRVVRKWDAVAILDAPRTTDLLDEIRGWEGVRDAEPIVVIPATIRVGDQEKDVRLTALDPSQELHVLQLPGDVQPQDALAPGRIVLVPALAQELGLESGEAVQVSTALGEAEFELGSTSDEPVGTNVYVSLQDVQVLAGAPAPFLNGLLLTVDPARAGTLKADLYAVPGVSHVELKVDTEGEWRSLMGLFYAFMGVVLVFTLAMAFALLFNTMTVNVLERQREFATMRAFGTSGGQIALHLAAENLLVWAIALIPGLLVGRAVAVQLAEAFNSELFSFRMVISPGSYLLASLGILITMMLAALPAVRRVNRLNLAEATRVLA